MKNILRELNTLSVGVDPRHIRLALLILTLLLLVLGAGAPSGGGGNLPG